MFEPTENKSRYINGILGYIIIFFLINVIISAIVQSIYISIHDINIDLFTEIIKSENYLIYLTDQYLNTEFFSTTVLIVKMSSTINLVSYILLISMCCVNFLKDFKIDASIFKNNESEENNLLNFTKKLLKFFFFYYACSYIIGFLTQFLNQIVDIDISNNQQFIEEALKYSPFAMIIAAGFLGPIVEELIFRKSIFGLIKNDKISLLVSTISFAMIHIISSFSLGYNFLQLLVMTIPYLTGGLLFGFIYLKTNKNIYYVILIHTFSNLISILFLLL